MYCRFKVPCGRGRLSSLFVGALVLPFVVGTALARDALAVSVITSEDIAELGVDSGDELLEYMAEQGQNFLNDAENISGGVNSARGDMGAYNLRNLGTGNTLVLLNGRRMVNSAVYQTELVGGSFVPVNTVNSQALPVLGLERLEILRDGASAIYGADAVAGVVNYVLKDDFDGFTLQARYAGWDGLPRNDYKISMEWGTNFNDGRTNLSVFASYYDREPINSQDDKYWAVSDHRYRIPDDSPFAGSTRFRRDSANSEFGQYDALSGTADITDGSGEFNTYPLDSDNCEFHPDDYPEIAALYPNVCFAVDGLYFGDLHATSSFDEVRCRRQVSHRG
jgi:outer membrane receptor protein involved in Fe transport